MYKIKQIPEDFIVEEITDLKTSENGCCGYFILEKIEWGTLDAIEKIARAVGINSNRLGFAGNKDKRAITKQFISIGEFNDWLRKGLEGLKIKGIGLRFLGCGDKRICLGDLSGNKFEIVVRNLDKDFKIGNINFIENYFDEQRFGINGKNCDVGRAIVKWEYGKACELLGLLNEGECFRKNYLQLLGKLGTRRLRFYIHAYQSYLWNCVLSEILSKSKNSRFTIDYILGGFVFLKGNMPTNLKGLEIPLINFDSKLEGEVGGIYKKLMKIESIKQEDFVFRSMPELVSEGVSRKAVVNVANFQCRFGSDELNKGKYKSILEFSLPAGSYASIVVKKIFGQQTFIN